MTAPSPAQPPDRGGTARLRVTYQTRGEGRPPGIELVRIHGDRPPIRFADGKDPHWAPDGRKLAHDSPSGIVIAHLGGLDASPLALAAKRSAAVLSVVASNQSEVVQQVYLRWEAFGGDSVRLGPACQSEEPAELKPGERVEWALEIPGEALANVRTVKIRVLNADGVGVVELLDWVQGQE